MKKIGLFILMLCCFISIPVVNAATATTSITGTNTVKVGETTKIYIKLNSSDKIEGADVSFSTSGNIKVTNVSVGSGLSNVMNDGNRYILYAKNPVASGSTLLVLTVQGTAKGTGTVSVTKLEATVSGQTVKSNNTSYKITVNAPQTQTANNQTTTTAASVDKQAIKKATTLVEAAERSLLEEDYDAALKAVNKLADSSEKQALLERLEQVKFKIEVLKECPTCAEVKCDDCEEKDCKPWIVLSIILFICLVAESIYLAYRISKQAE